MTRLDRMPPEVFAQVVDRATLQSRLLWSASEVAFLLGISERTVWQWTASDEFPAPRKRGKRTMWVADEVRKWIEASPKLGGKLRGA